MKNLNTVICAILNISEQDFTRLVKERGMKPTKAAIRLGADPREAQLFAGLKLATSAQHIDEVYANTNILSCMQGQNVGKFYEANDFGVIYSDNFRCLINVKTGALVRSNHRSTFGYGYHRDQICHVLAEHYTSDELVTNVVYTERPVIVGYTNTTSEQFEVTVYHYKIDKLFCNGEQIRLDYYGSSIKFDKEELNCIFKKVQEEVIKNLNTEEVHINCLDKKYVVNLKKVQQQSSVREVENKCYLPGNTLVRNLRKLKSIYNDRFFSKKIPSAFFGMSLGDVMISVYDVIGKVIDVKKPIRKMKLQQRLGLVVPKDAYYPYIDFTFNDTWKDVEVYEDVTRQEALEEHYWKRLGDSYREAYNRPRTNY